MRSTVCASGGNHPYPLLRNGFECSFQYALYGASFSLNLKSPEIGAVVRNRCAQMALTIRGDRHTHVRIYPSTSSMSAIAAPSPWRCPSL
jgi:hypothetical protein